MLAQLSGFEVMRLVNELKALEGAFLQKVYEPWEGLFVLRFKAKSGKKALVHKLGDWVYLTDESELGMDLGATSEDGTADVPAFVRVLRDHITNAFVIGARQLAFDRIIELELRKDDPYYLVFEMFGEGNIILRRESTIVAALKTQVWRHRVIMAGKDYRPPPLRKDPRSMELAELTVLLKESTADLVRSLATSVNLGGTYAEEVCFRVGLDKGLKAKDLEIEQIKAIQEAIKTITSEISNETGGIVHSRNGERAVVSAIRLKKFEGNPVENFVDLSSAVKACFPLYEDQVSQAVSVGKARPQR
jgi:predicted ribosome quality control (RQC) complex YloA/Tae2 family protein